MGGWWAVVVVRNADLIRLPTGIPFGHPTGIPFGHREPCKGVAIHRIADFIFCHGLLRVARNDESHLISLSLYAFLLRDKAQYKAAAMMEIRFGTWMAQRPVREAAGLVFDDGGEADAQGVVGELAETKLRFEHEAVGLCLQRDTRRLAGSQRRHSGAVTEEAISRPCGGGREIAFDISGMILRCDERFEAGVAPQFIRGL